MRVGIPLSIICMLAVSAGAGDLPNSMCPVMTLEPADPQFHVTYQGREVYFCCDRCIKRFVSDPQRYLARLPQFAEGAEPPAQPPPAGGAGTETGAGIGSGVQAEGDVQVVLEPGPAVPLPGRLHPALVHFPVAGLPLALFGFLAWKLTGRPGLAAADTVPLALAALSSIAAVITGNIAHDHMRFAANLADFLYWHEKAGYGVLGLTWAALVVRVASRRRFTRSWAILYSGLLIAGCAAAGAAGYLGGGLVFGVDHLAW